MNKMGIVNWDSLRLKIELVGWIPVKSWIGPVM